jgi:hypothetical protein
MREIPTIHNIQNSKALRNRAVYGGVYTSDLVSISGIAFLISRVMAERSVKEIYTVMALICIPFYFFLIVKNNLLPRAWFLMRFRKILGGNSLVMHPLRIKKD